MTGSAWGRPADVLGWLRRRSEWEGAAERLLHGFGISLLVPDCCFLFPACF